MEPLSRAAAPVAQVSGPLKKKLELLTEPATRTTTESNYVDLSGSAADTKTVKVTFTGDASQLAMFKWRSAGDWRAEPLKDEFADLTDSTASEPTGTGTDSSDVTSVKTEETEDMYLNSRCESDDGDDASVRRETDAESHYITTHEIQLTELDHDVDCELGRGSCWDYDDDHLVYSFVDYASFESGGGGGGGGADERDRRKAKSSHHAPRLADTGALASTESEFCESEKLASSESSPGKARDDVNDDGDGGNPQGRIRLSIKACSRAVCENGSDRYRDFFEIAGGKCDSRAFIPAPGRVHLASKRKGRDVNECSSCASSSVSELDDADKEVRNLTAKTFRSLACPYFDAINLRTSSESSMSEYGLGVRAWSALMNGNVASANFNGKPLGDERTPRAGATASPVNKTTEPVVRNESVRNDAGTSNLTGEKSAARVPDASGCSCCARVPLETGSEENDDGGAGDGCKKAVFASSLLQNLISKRMRSEHDRKMEVMSASSPRAPPPPPWDGDTPNPNPNPSPSDLQRQTSETGSAASVISAEEHGDAVNGAFRASKEERKEDAGVSAAEPGTEAGASNEKVPVARSRNSAFQSLKEEESLEAGDRLAETPVGRDEKKEMDTGKTECTSDKTTKMSHLYVPSSNLTSAGKREPEQLPPRDRVKAMSTRGPDASKRASGIEIRVRGVQESKCEPFSIADLLTPNVACSSAKYGVDPKAHVLSGTDRVPHFTVRNVRENKCKLQTPIHHVRDVRKLVKSSYRFVSVETGAKASVKKEPDKTGASAAPMVIKCQSVNTKVSRAPEKDEKAGETSPKRVGRNETHVKTETKPVKARTEKVPDGYEKRPDGGTFDNRAALEKLKAAVKTMEELYVFDRNEWRRKTEAPRPLTDSHVLSLIKTGSEEELNKVREACTGQRNNRGTERMRTKTDTFVDCRSKHFRTTSSSLQETSRTQQGSENRNCSGTRTEERLGKVPDSENYLSIPVHTNQKPALVPAPVSTTAAAARIPPPARPPLQRSPVITDSWSPGSPPAMMYRPAAPLLCLTPPVERPPPNTQRKLLLDPVTGLCYLVDTPFPLQPAAQRLYCPENACYVDVPLSGTPVPLSGTPVPFTVPMPVPMSGVTLGPTAAYAPAYMVYPPTLFPPLLPHRLEGEGGVSGGRATESPYLDPRTSGTKPVISITSQQGPRIVAPPSFDGTTMSFVVEHR